MEYSHSSQEENTNIRGNKSSMERLKTTRGWTDIKAAKEKSAKLSAQNASTIARLAKDPSGDYETH